MNIKGLLIRILLLISSVVMSLSFVQASGEGTTLIDTGQWLAVYYPNEDLSGNPVAIQSEESIGGNWEFAAPIVSLPVDHWSARWTRTFNLIPAQYRITVRADDGVRVYVNNNLILNEWHGHLPQTYTVDFTVNNPIQTINVEFFDGTLQAYLTFELARIDGIQTFPVGTTATILYNNTYGYLEPSTAATVRYLLPAGAVYEVISTTFDGQWLQLRVLGTGVWVPAAFVQVNHVSPPIIPPQPTIVPAQPTRIPPVSSSQYPQATVTSGILNVREAPDSGSRVLMQIRQGETYTVRRASTNGWLQLIVNGQLGWVSGELVSLNTLNNLVYLAGTANATVNAARLNVRSRPTMNSAVVTKVNRPENHAIVGRDATGQWILLDVNGTFGWVNRFYVDVDAPAPLPVVSDIPPIIPPAREYIVATATPYNVNMRQSPSENSADLGNFARGDDAKIIGRTADNSWWQIEYNGIRAWVAAAFAPIQGNADINAIPITG